MTELESWIFCANVIHALTPYRIGVHQITVKEDGSTLRVEVQDGRSGIVQCAIPPGHFAYDQVARVIAREFDHCMESEV